MQKSENCVCIFATSYFHSHPMESFAALVWFFTFYGNIHGDFPFKNCNIRKVFRVLSLFQPVRLSIIHCHIQRNTEKVFHAQLFMFFFSRQFPRKKDSSALQALELYHFVKFKTFSMEKKRCSINTNCKQCENILNIGRSIIIRIFQSTNHSAS